MRPSQASAGRRPERLAPALSPRAGGVAERGWSDADTADLPRRERPHRVRVAIMALGVAALALPPVLALALWATAPTAAELDARWHRDAGFDPLARFPAREATASALRIEEVARPLGLELAPERADRRPRLLPRMRSDLGPLWSAARATFQGLRSPGAALVALPPPAVEGLDTVSSDLLAVRETLLGEEPPRWERDLAAGWNAPLPDLLAHQRLHRLLALAAYRAAVAGDRDEAAAWLDAAWRLQGSLADEPHLYAQLVAGSELQDELALLRVLPAPPDGWGERLAEHTVRSQVHDALRVEAWLAVQSLHRGMPFGRSAEPPEGYVLRRVLAPLWWARVRHGIGHVVESVDHAIARAEREGAAALGASFVNEERGRIPRWSGFGRTLATNLLDAPLDAARFELGVELNRQLIGLAARRDRGEVAARATVPSAVAGVAWEQEPQNGRMVVRASREVPAAGPHPLPLRAALPWPETPARP